MQNDDQRAVVTDRGLIPAELDMSWWSREFGVVGMASSEYDSISL